MAQGDQEREKLVNEVGLLKNRIAELEKLYSELKQQHLDIKRYKTVVNDSNDAVIICDPDGKISAWNKGAMLMYGYSEQEALCMNIELLTAPDKVAEYKAFTRRLLEGEDVSSFETQRITKNGKILDVWLTVTKLAEPPTDSIISTGRDITEKNIAIALIERNITERKKMDEQIKLQAQFIQDSPVPAAYHDKDLNIIWANNAYLKSTGLSLEEMKGKKCYYAWNLSKPCRGCPVREAIETGKNAAFELRPDNQDHWPETQGYWLSEASPVRDEHGVVIGALEFAINITESRKSEHELKKRLQELEIFYKASIGREGRIIELKKEIETLKKELGK